MRGFGSLLIILGVLCSLHAQAADTLILDVEAVKSNSVFSDLLQKTREGVLDMQSVESMDKTLSMELMTIGVANEQSMDSMPREKWTTENVTEITDALAGYIAKYNIPSRSPHLEVVSKHLQEFASFKTAVYSTFPVSPELAKVIAGNVARGIRWAVRPEAVYPSEEERFIAKEQVQEYLDWLEWFLVDRSQIDIRSVIAEEKEFFIKQMQWRVDSPFFVVGKKVFTDFDLDKIRSEAYIDLKKKFLDAQDFIKFPEVDPKLAAVADNYHQVFIRSVFRIGSRIYYRAFDPDRSRAPSLEESREVEKFIKAIQKKDYTYSLKR